MDNTLPQPGVSPEQAGGNLVPPQRQAQTDSTGSSGGTAPPRPAEAATPVGAATGAGSKAADEVEITPATVTKGLLVSIPLMILGQIAEFFEFLIDIVKWIIGLFKNKWFLIAFAIVVIFLILAVIGSNMQTESTLTK